MLFLGNFRHVPNQGSARLVHSACLAGCAGKVSASRGLVIVGSEPPPKHSLPDLGPAIELRGFVEDVREPLARYAVFRLSDSKWFRNAREAAGGILRRHSRGIDARGR